MSGPYAFTTSRCTDPARLAEIRAVVRAAFAGLQPPSGVLSETLDDFAARMRAGPVLIAEADGGIIGSVFCVQDGDALYLTRLATLPSRRNHGVARALLAAAEEQARRIGATRLTLRARVSLPENRRYFEQAGFAVTGQGQDPGRPPYHTMERHLRGQRLP